MPVQQFAISGDILSDHRVKKWVGGVGHRVSDTQNRRKLIILNPPAPWGRPGWEDILLKAERATNRRNGSRASCQGRAQNLRFTISWAWSQILGLQLPCFKTSVFIRFSPHWHPRSSHGGQCWPSLVPPFQLHNDSESKFNPLWHHKSHI